VCRNLRACTAILQRRQRHVFSVQSNPRAPHHWAGRPSPSACRWCSLIRQRPADPCPAPQARWPPHLVVHHRLEVSFLVYGMQQSAPPAPTPANINRGATECVRARCAITCVASMYKPPMCHVALPQEATCAVSDADCYVMLGSRWLPGCQHPSNVLCITSAVLALRPRLLQSLVMFQVNTHAWAGAADSRHARFLWAQTIRPADARLAAANTAQHGCPRRRNTTRGHESAHNTTCSCCLCIGLQ
jgi:hypothetical protein